MNNWYFKILHYNISNNVNNELDIEQFCCSFLIFLIHILRKTKCQTRLLDLGKSLWWETLVFGDGKHFDLMLGNPSIWWWETRLFGYRNSADFVWLNVTEKYLLEPKIHLNWLLYIAILNHMCILSVKVIVKGIAVLKKNCLLFTWEKNILDKQYLLWSFKHSLFLDFFPKT